MVAIQPYQGIDAQSVEAARHALESVSNAKVVVLPESPLPSVAYYKQRGRYRAEKLLTDLDSNPYWHVVGLTAKDISTTKGSHLDWGLFGLGNCPGRACVVSTYRLRGRRDWLAKVVVHEFGHTLGLPHCPTPHCLMNDAKGKATTVEAETRFCRLCLAKARGTLHNRAS